MVRKELMFIVSCCRNSIHSSRIDHLLFTVNWFVQVPGNHRRPAVIGVHWRLESSSPWTVAIGVHWRLESSSPWTAAIGVHGRLESSSPWTVELSSRTLSSRRMEHRQRPRDKFQQQRWRRDKHGPERGGNTESSWHSYYSYFRFPSRRNPEFSLLIGNGSWLRLDRKPMGIRC